jgi:DMSO reductase anchor subunit
VLGAQPTFRRPLLVVEDLEVARLRTSPALSIIIFTTLAGASQGLAVVLALSQLFDAGPDNAFVARSLWVAVALAIVSLTASFLHLGRPERACRAAMMWRTSWMSREVIVLPTFILLKGVWACMLTFSERPGEVPALLPLAVITASALLWYCSAIIYACIKFIQEWRIR